MVTSLIRKKILRARLLGIQSSANYPTSSFLQGLEQELILQFNQVLRLEEEFWKLKSRVNWLNNGDANTRFFHLTTLKRRIRNHITALKDTNGNWINDEHQLKSMITNFYNDLYQTSHLYSQKTHESSNFNTLSNTSIDALIQPLTDIETMQAVFSFNPHKSPGPDGLHPLFF